VQQDLLPIRPFPPAQKPFLPQGGLEALLLLLLLLLPLLPQEPRCLDLPVRGPGALYALPALYLRQLSTWVDQEVDLVEEESLTATSWDQMRSFVL